MCRASLRGRALHDSGRHHSRIFRLDRRLCPAAAGLGAGLDARLPSRGVDVGAGPDLAPTCNSIWSKALRSGKEWQLGYWKHPPLPWWVTDLAYRLTGVIDAVYVLGPLAAVICFYAVWLLARDVTDELKALIAVAALEAHPLLQHLGREICARPDAIAVLGADRTVLLARDRPRADLRLDAGRAVPRRRVLVEIRRVRIGRDARLDPAFRPVRAARLAHTRALCDGRRVRDRDRAECLVALQQ